MKPEDVKLINLILYCSIYCINEILKPAVHCPVWHWFHTTSNRKINFRIAIVWTNKVHTRICCDPCL